MSTRRPQWQRTLSAVARAGCYLGLFLFWQFAVSTIYSAAISFELGMGGGLNQQKLLDAVLARTMEISLVSGLLTLVSVILFFLVRHESLRRELWLRPADWRVFALGAGLAFCLFWIVSIVMSALPKAWLEGYEQASAGLEETGTAALIATALVAPVVEEVIFRGLVYTRLEQGMPWPVAVVVSALLFGACHGEVVWFCYAFVLGLIFALITCATRSILPGMLMHIIFNSTNELLALLGEWGPSGPAVAGIFILALAVAAACAWGLFRRLAPGNTPLRHRQTS